MNNVSDKTLHAILTNAGIFTPVVGACVAGRLSRSFGNRDVTLAWKTREAYYWLAEESVVGTEQITIAKIIFKIMPELPLDVFILEGMPETVCQFKRTFRKLRMMTVDGIWDRHRPTIPALTNGELGSLNFADMRSLISAKQIYA